MKAGALDRFLTIEKATVTKDAFNNDVLAWAYFTRVRAAMNNGGVTETLTAREKGAAITLRFDIRYSSRAAQITPAMRLDFEGRKFDIAGLQPIGRRRGFTITATARAE